MGMYDSVGATCCIGDGKIVTGSGSRHTGENISSESEEGEKALAVDVITEYRNGIRVWQTRK